MAYNYIREPLQTEEADALCQACETMQEKLIIWTLLDTGLRISELCSLSPHNIEWQQKALRITGKGGPHGKKSKKRVVPMSRRVQTLLEHYFAINDHQRVNSSNWASVLFDFQSCLSVCMLEEVYSGPTFLAEGGSI